MVSATRYAASPVGWSESIAARRIAASIGSTEITVAPMRPARISAMVDFPEPGSPAIAISIGTRTSPNCRSSGAPCCSGMSDQFGPTGHGGARVVLAGGEPVVGLPRARFPAVQGHAHLALGEDGQQRLVAGQDTDLPLHGARNDHARLTRPHFVVGGDDADSEDSHASRSPSGSAPTSPRRRRSLRR